MPETLHSFFSPKGTRKIGGPSSRQRDCGSSENTINLSVSWSDEADPEVKILKTGLL
jgi:hypothetical protein